MSHDDELLSYQISARLSEIGFGYLWNRMSSLGWTYDSNNSEYLTPFGINLGSGKEAMITLDLFALPSLSFRPNDGGVAILHQKYDTETTGKLQTTRDDLLKAIFFDCQKHGEEESVKSKGRTRKSKAGNATVVSNYNYQTGCDHLDSNSHRRSFDSDHEGIFTSETEKTTMSATQNEPGTEQFFAKKVRRTGKTKTFQSSYITSKSNKDKPSEEDSTLGIHEKHNNDNDNNNTLGNKDKHDIHVDQNQKLIFGSFQLVWPNPQECVDALRSRESDQKENNQSQTSSRFLKKFALEWKFLLSTNHSLILYGFGSKRNLLNDFAEQELNKYGDVLTLDGYDSEISIGGILDIIVQTLLNGEEPSYTETTTTYKDSLPSDLICRAIAISKYIAKSHPRPIYLVLHNIDGLKLRSQVAQNCLAALVANSAIRSTTTVGTDSNQTRNSNAQVIRLITSVDRVDAVEILWDVTCTANFSWIWKQASTYDPYHDEVMFTITDETRKVKEERRDELDLHFMQKTLSSLAPRHTEVLKVLAQLQIAKARGSQKSTKKSCFDCVQYKLLKENCVKEMVLSSDTDLKNIMNELLDHGMVVKQFDADNEEIVSIPTTKSKILEILNLISGSF